MVFFVLFFFFNKRGYSHFNTSLDLIFSDLRDLVIFEMLLLDALNS